MPPPQGLLKGLSPRFEVCPLGFPQNPASVSGCTGISPRPAVGMEREKPKWDHQGSARAPQSRSENQDRSEEEEGRIASPHSEHTELIPSPPPGAKETPKTHHRGLKTKPQSPASLQEAELGWREAEPQLQQHQSHPRAHHNHSNGFAPESWRSATAGVEPSPCY